MPAITLDEVSLSYSSHLVLDRVSLHHYYRHAFSYP